MTAGAWTWSVVKSPAGFAPWEPGAKPPRGFRVIEMGHTEQSAKLAAAEYQRIAVKQLAETLQERAA